MLNIECIAPITTSLRMKKGAHLLGLLCCWAAGAAGFASAPGSGPWSALARRGSLCPHAQARARAGNPGQGLRMGLFDFLKPVDVRDADRGTNSQNALSIVTLYSTHTRALTCDTRRRSRAAARRVAGAPGHCERLKSSKCILCRTLYCTYTRALTFQSSDRQALLLEPRNRHAETSNTNEKHVKKKNLFVTVYMYRKYTRALTFENFPF